MMNLKCCVRLNDDWKTEIEATLIGFVHTGINVPYRSYYSENWCSGMINPVSSVVGIVKLETFSSGSLFQLPLHLIKIVE